MRLHTFCEVVVVPLALLAFLSAAILAEAEVPPDIKGPYLGQESPGTTPQIFSPRFISTDQFEFSGVFSRDLDQFIFVRRGGELSKNNVMMTQMENEVWSQPVALELRGERTAPWTELHRAGRCNVGRTKTDQRGTEGSSNHAPFIFDQRHTVH